MFVWACGFELAIGLIGLLIAGILGIDARAYLPKLDELDWHSVGRDCLIGAAASIPMLISIAALMRIPHNSIVAIKRLSDAPMMKALLSLSYPELIVLSVCAGIGEEVAFRGCLLPWLTALEDPSFVNPYDVGDTFLLAEPSMLMAAILFSSIAFGLLHPITKLYVFVATLMGMFFAVLMIATDSLLVPIVTHIVYDAAQFALAKRESSQSPAAETADAAG